MLSADPGVILKTQPHLSQDMNFGAEIQPCTRMAVGTMVGANDEDVGQSTGQDGFVVRIAKVTDSDVKPRHVNVDGEDCAGNITYMSA